MKSRFTLLLLSLILLCATGLNAQINLGGFSSQLLKPYESPAFAVDLIIHDQPDRDQRNIAICSAFNGWLFCVYSFIDINENFPYLTVLKSIDNGLTWSVISEEPFANPGYVFTTLDIVTTGDSLSNLKIILAGLTKIGSNDMGFAFALRLNGTTGIFEGYLIPEVIAYDIALATDNGYPAINSSPSSLGILYSKAGSTIDSLIFRSSDDGGLTLNNRKTVTVTGSKLYNVALAYGRCPAFPNGNYFAAWEEHNGLGAMPGKIFTAHTYPSFNSSFTTPVNLDGLDPSSANNAMNPSIACQFSDTDNDSANLTEVVMFEKYVPATNGYDLTGLYNLQAMSSDHFQGFTVSPSPDNKQQPDISFNPDNFTFMLTYFDSTTRKLPYLTHDVNMENPDVWNIVNPGYNDSSNITAPYPKVDLNIAAQDGMNVWIADRTNGNGEALFDAPFHYYTGINPVTQPGNLVCKIYPNPATDNVTIETSVSSYLNIMNLNGQQLITRQITEPKTQLDISNLPSGVYFVRLMDDKTVRVVKFVKH